MLISGATASAADDIALMHAPIRMALMVFPLRLAPLAARISYDDAGAAVDGHRAAAHASGAPGIRHVHIGDSGVQPGGCFADPGST
jgi:hypothetical protein